MSEDWYLIGTLEGGDIRGGAPLAIMGPWPREEAQQKYDQMRAKYPKQSFAILPGNKVDLTNGTVELP